MSTRSALCALLALALASGCRQDMHDQPRSEPFEQSSFFADGVAWRLPVAGTVARGRLFDDPHLHLGVGADGGFATSFPMPVTMEVLTEGRRHYGSFCAPCHAYTGDGRGTVVRRGFEQPTSFHEERLRRQPVGYFFDVISNGFGNMSSYAVQLEPEERWQVVAYLRALQQSQHRPAAELAATDRAAVESGRRVGADAGEASH